MGWLKNRARKRLLEQPFPEGWRAVLSARAPFFAQLEEPERTRFEQLLQVFVAEKTFIGAGGFAIDDEVRVVIAACAVRLVLHLDIDRFDRLSEIVVYPSAYQRPSEEPVFLGEAHAWGTVVLAWDSVCEGLSLPHDGHDVVLHELAHVLDREQGSFDGTPTLRARAHYRPWALVMSEHFLRLRHDKAPENAVLDGYATTNEAEFFAVATETFFERPEALRARLPDLYRELARFYRGDEKGE
jgi:Mlc titration factor MtfA (ptsG expression regulator)